MNRRQALRLFAAILATTGVWSLVFWFTLDGRLPTDDDWVSAHSLIEKQATAGDAVVLAPSWATRGRDFIPSLPVFTLDDFQNGELLGVSRVWLVALANAPRFSPSKALALVGPNCGAAERIGALFVQACERQTPKLRWRLSDEIRSARVRIDGKKPTPCPWRDNRFECSNEPWNTVHAGWFEVEEHPMRCVWAHPVGKDALEIRFDAVSRGGLLRGRGAFVGQAAGRSGAPLDVAVTSGQQVLGRVRFENRFGRQPFEFALPPSAEPASLTFSVTTPHRGGRYFCIDAWVEEDNDGVVASPE